MAAGVISCRVGLWQGGAVVASVALALGLGAMPATRGFQFTGWIVAAVTASMCFPSAFLHWGSFDLRNKWVILLVVQLVMFGMGTQMSLADFKGVAKTPRGVLVGIVCHFSIMPLVGVALTKVFAFPPEIAAGIILIGSCSSGLASNVMAYLAGANLVLSVTVTAITTLVAPFMTPLLMKLFAGTLVEVKFVNMMMEIIKIVIVPIGAALLHDYLKTASATGRRWVHVIAVAAALWLAMLALGGWGWVAGQVGESARLVIGTLGFFLAAVLVGLLYHVAVRRWPAIGRKMPLGSMAGIVYFTAVTTAAGRDNLLQIGALLFVAAALHNAAGYFFGYWLSRGAGLDKNSARSVAFEVGLQNGGMASGLAGSMGKLATVGLAAAIFSPWMNISGSILANYWRRRKA
ncbi:bile acid:sodium symporter family protein [Opitutus sp. ER46]|uniref:bile acid:sodium symporter family protein n=1 Tax=Opitutus sp. ER46 TaxID=2161864 RepID=UPI0031B895BE